MIEIRKATLHDAPAIGALVRASAERHILPALPVEGRERFLRDHDDASIVRRMQDGFAYHVAERDGRLVGVVGVRPPAHLYHLFVVDDERGRGLGRRLWSHAHVEVGAPEAVTVNASLNAVGAYARFGFVTDGEPVDVDGVHFQPMRWPA